MSNWLTTYDPFEAMDAFEKAFWGTPSRSGNYPMSFGIDISNEGDAYQLKADLPGFKKEDIHVNVEKDTITVSAERHSEIEDNDKKSKFLRKERSFGSYQRSFTVGDRIDKTQIQAKYENGVLTLTLPKKAEPEQKTFDIVVE